jgi:hypothetical protein
MPRALLLLFCLAFPFALGMSKKIGGPLGGHEALNDLQDPTVLSAAAKIAAEVDKQSPSAFSMGVVRVVEGTSQVVSGVKYVLTVELAESSCLKAAGGPPCPPQPGKASQLVSASVWAQPWRNFYEVTML